MFPALSEALDTTEQYSGGVWVWHNINRWIMVLRANATGNYLFPSSPSAIHDFTT